MVFTTGAPFGRPQCYPSTSFFAPQPNRACRSSFGGVGRVFPRTPVCRPFFGAFPYSRCSPSVHYPNPSVVSYCPRPLSHSLFDIFANALLRTTCR